MLDLINACFVSLAVAAAAADVWRVWHDKVLTGMHLGTAVLFTVWPLWDCIYYRGLGQTFSLVACGLLVCFRMLWMGLICLGL